MPLWGKKHTRQSSGKPIKARTINELADTCDRVSRITASSPLAIDYSAGGVLLRWAGPIFGAYTGITNGSISARSGLTPGTGNVSLYTWNGTAVATLGSPVQTFVVQSLFPVGFATGRKVIILRIAGTYWIIWEEPTTYWCTTSGTVAAATGAVGSRTAGSLAAQTVYVTLSGSDVALPGSYSVKNWWPSAMAASKTTLLSPSGDSSFDIVTQAC